MLYESGWLFLAGAWLWWRRGRSPFLFGEYLIAQGLGRAVIEHWRENPPLLGPLTNAQVVAILCLLAGIAGWSYFARRRPEEARAA
jgi:prolipoprotein diacylglyceryltransferase